MIREKPEKQSEVNNFNISNFLHMIVKNSFFMYTHQEGPAYTRGTKSRYTVIYTNIQYTCVHTFGPPYIRGHITKELITHRCTIINYFNQV